MRSMASRTFDWRQSGWPRRGTHKVWSRWEAGEERRTVPSYSESSPRKECSWKLASRFKKTSREALPSVPEEDVAIARWTSARCQALWTGRGWRDSTLSGMPRLLGFQKVCQESTVPNFVLEMEVSRNDTLVSECSHLSTTKPWARCAAK